MRELRQAAAAADLSAIRSPVIPPARSSTRLLADLWESENIPFAWQGNTPVKIPLRYDSTTPVDRQIDRAIEKLALTDKPFADSVANEVSHLQTHFNALPPGVSILPPSDLKLDYEPTNCTLVGILRYEGNLDVLNYSSEYFSHLRTPTDEAAAWIHEAVYKVLRDTQGHTDSNMARHLTACLFSNSSTCINTKPFQYPKDRDVYHCHDDLSDFYLYPLMAGPTNYEYPQTWRITFLKVAGNPYPQGLTFDNGRVGWMGDDGYAYWSGYGIEAKDVPKLSPLSDFNITSMTGGYYFGIQRHSPTDQDRIVLFEGGFKFGSGTYVQTSYHADNPLLKACTKVN